MEDLNEDLMENGDHEINKINEIIESLLSDLELGIINRNFREGKLTSDGIREFKTRRGDICLIKGYSIKGGEIDGVHQVFPCAVVRVRSNEILWEVELVSCCHYHKSFKKTYHRKKPIQNLHLN